MVGTPLLYGVFIAFVVAALVVDFVVLGREGAHRVGLARSRHLVGDLGRVVAAVRGVPVVVARALRRPRDGRYARASRSSPAT